MNIKNLKTIIKEFYDKYIKPFLKGMLLAYSAKSSYNRYKEILSNKYILSNEYMFFSSPYSEGDGYELSALYKDKCRFKSFFKDSLDNNISLELISFKYEVVNTVIQYENKIAADLNKKEKVEIANKTF